MPGATRTPPDVGGGFTPPTRSRWWVVTGWLATGEMVLAGVLTFHAYRTESLRGVLVGAVTAVVSAVAVLVALGGNERARPLSMILVAMVGAAGLALAFLLIVSSWFVVPTHRTPTATLPTAFPSVSHSSPSARTATHAAPGPDISWVSAYGVQLPVSRSHGPFAASGVLVMGFSRDEPGAALAATHYAARMSPQVGPNVYGPTIREFGIGGGPATLAAMHTQYEDARASQAGVPDGSPLISPYNPRILGYRIDPISNPGAAPAYVVHLLSSADGPQGAVLVDLPVTVWWIAQTTWKVEVPSDGNFPGFQARSTAHFTLF